jgi:methionyl-tRNA formyltransferase
MKKFIFLGNDTIHRRYFLSRLLERGVKFEKIFFETNSVKPKFDIHSIFDSEEKYFEQHNFTNLLDFEINDLATYVDSINSNEVLNFINSYNIDIAIVFGAGKVSDEILNSLTLFGLNVHRGIAEEYRGLDSNLWALYHGDIENMGVTIHKINSQLDTGEILFQKKIVYPKTVEIFSLRFFETIESINLVFNAILMLQNDEIIFRKQNKIGRYYSFMPSCIKNSLTTKKLKKT